MDPGGSVNSGGAPGAKIELIGNSMELLGGIDSITGFGVQATVAGREVLVGADRLMRREELSIEALAEKAKSTPDPVACSPCTQLFLQLM